MPRKAATIVELQFYSPMGELIGKKYTGQEVAEFGSNPVPAVALRLDPEKPSHLTFVYGVPFRVTIDDSGAIVMPDPPLLKLA